MTFWAFIGGFLHLHCELMNKKFWIIFYAFFVFSVIWKDCPVYVEMAGWFSRSLITEIP